MPVLILFLAIYVLPSFVAGARGHKNVGPIIIVNLFLGWTLIGWVVALAWAASAQEAVRA